MAITTATAGMAGTATVTVTVTVTVIAAERVGAQRVRHGQSEGTH